MNLKEMPLEEIITHLVNCIISYAEDDADDKTLWKGADRYRTELLRRFKDLEQKVEEGQKALHGLYLFVSSGIISRWRCAELLGINLADMDEWEDCQAKKVNK
jgi:hypothetical protein